MTNYATKQFDPLLSPLATDTLLVVRLDATGKVVATGSYPVNTLMATLGTQVVADATAVVIPYRDAAIVAKNEAQAASENSEQSSVEALASQNAAQASLASMSLRYAGASATAPATPAVGMVWYDTTTNALKVYNGTAWVVATADAVNVGFSPTGTVLTGTSVQSALAELGGLGLSVIDGQLCMTHVN